jgi:DNA/RNA-binding domain of Phe-tRNA-synthetase-like protein
VVLPLEVRTTPELQVAYAVCRSVEVREVRADVILEVLRLVEEVRSSLDEELVRRDKILSLYRSFLERRLGGITDVKVYPELLLKRVLSGRSFPQYNSVVDLVNAVSLVTRLAMSVLDLRKLTPPLRMVYLDRDTSVGDAKGRVMKLRRGVPVLVDSRGRVLYVYPYKVTGEAYVDPNTRDVIVLSYGAPGIPLTTLIGGIAKVVEYLLNYDHSVSCSSVWTSLQGP